MAGSAGKGEDGVLGRMTLDADPPLVDAPRVGWRDFAGEGSQRVREESVPVRSSVVARAASAALSSGMGGYRVREVIRRVGAALGLECRSSVTLMGAQITVTDGTKLFTEVVEVSGAGVNTGRMRMVEDFVCTVERYGSALTVADVHGLLDGIEHTPAYYGWAASGLASALACGAFVFLLGGGLVEMLCAAAGAGAGQALRKILGPRHVNVFFTTMLAVALSCLVYLGVLSLVDLAVPGAAALHQAGYIGAMLFVIPGFPLITSGLDVARMNLASGIERFVYAACIIGVATLAGWFVAKLTTLYPAELVSPDLAPAALAALRFIASVVGVYGFSVLFDSPPSMAATAACIGAVANTLRLELVDLASLPPEAAALVGALVAGLLASAVGPRVRLPRVTLTVPSIVIMVPGLYLYEAMYYLCDFDVLNAMGWGVRAMAVIACLPAGLALARFLTDRSWRHG